MNTHGKLKLAVLISGRGSNMAAIARAGLDGQLAAELVLVISDRGDAAGIPAASALGLATAVIEARVYEGRAVFEAALGEAIDRSGAELLVLAGFMRILSAAFVQRYAGRLLNIHPSLLPKYKGLHTHRRVLQAGEREHGASVHFVTDELDGGPVICQARVAVQADDTEQSLAARVVLQEHRIYPMVIGLIAAGRLKLQGATIVLDGQALNAPIVEDEQHAQRPVNAGAHA
jgi:phosphoribosylglycinamide formyltransferase-1